MGIKPYKAYTFMFDLSESSMKTWFKDLFGKFN